MWGKDDVDRVMKTLFWNCRSWESPLFTSSFGLQVATRPRLQDPELSLLFVPWLVPAWELDVSVRDLSFLFTSFLSGERYFRVQILQVFYRLFNHFLRSFGGQLCRGCHTHPNRQHQEEGRSQRSPSLSFFQSLHVWRSCVSLCSVYSTHGFSIQCFVTLMWFSSNWCINTDGSLSRNEFQIFLKYGCSWAHGSMSLLCWVKIYALFMLWVVSGDLKRGFFFQWPAAYW